MGSNVFTEAAGALVDSVPLLLQPRSTLWNFSFSWNSKHARNAAQRRRSAPPIETAAATGRAASQQWQPRGAPENRRLNPEESSHASALRRSPRALSATCDPPVTAGPPSVDRGSKAYCPRRQRQTGTARQTGREHTFTKT
eukprot:COSAG01_NODE_4449_length_5009_cov_5.851731_10_plen_140_part_01